MGGELPFVSRSRSWFSSPEQRSIQQVKGSARWLSLFLLREWSPGRIFLLTQIRVRMRPSVLLPAALLICACTKTGDQPSAKTTDSAKPVDSATGAPASATTNKSAGAKKADTTAAISSATSASPSDVAPPGAETKKPGPVDTRCGVKGNPVLSDLGIGNLAIGRTVTTVKRTCRVIRDIEELASGSLDRVLTVVIGGDVYRATVAGDLVSRITVRTPRVATRDGLRVGTPLSRVASLKGVKIAEGEDGLYMLPESHCGLSFRFSIVSRWPTGRAWTMTELLRRHGGTPVDRIFVSRCMNPR